MQPCERGEDPGDKGTWWKAFMCPALAVILKWLSGNVEGLWILTWSLTERVTCWSWV